MVALVLFKKVYSSLSLAREYIHYIAGETKLVSATSDMANVNLGVYKATCIWKFVQCQWPHLGFR